MGQGGVTAEQSLLQQLHQVQEELERHYLKCVELDAELQLARSDREDAAREAATLRLLLAQMQRELSRGTSDATRPSFARRIRARVVRRRSRGNDAEESGQAAELEEIRSSGCFDAGWYLATYEDVRTAGVDPVAHYHEFGWKEGRNPGPAFDTGWYLLAYPDVAATGLDPLWHFVRYARQEGRLPRES